MCKQDDDLIDLTMDDLSTPMPFKALKISKNGSSSDLRTVDGAKRRSRESSSSPQRPQNTGRGNKKSSNGRDGPSDAVIAAWRRGDDDLEPSAKMLALIEYLKAWDASGDKTICYSQCRLLFFAVEVTTDPAYCCRDIYA